MNFLTFSLSNQTGLNPSPMKIAGNCLGMIDFKLTAAVQLNCEYAKRPPIDQPVEHDVKVLRCHRRPLLHRNVGFHALFFQLGPHLFRHFFLHAALDVDAERLAEERLEPAFLPGKLLRVLNFNDDHRMSSELVYV